MILVQGLHVSYGDFEAVRGIDLEVSRGEVFAFLGPNGARKTTTVELLEGYLKRSAGEVAVLGVDSKDGSSFFGGAAPDAAERPRLHPGSTTDAALGPCSSARFLVGSPAFHLGSQPELHAARSQVEHRLRHVGVPPLILGDGVAVSEAKDFGNALCVEKILGVDLRGHAS